MLSDAGDSMVDKDIGKQLKTIYKALLKAYGPQHGWPGDTPFEVMVGAVPTQVGPLRSVA